MSLVPTSPQEQSLAITFSREQIDLIKETVAKGATDVELKLFLYHAAKTGLDPLAKQIYFQKRRTKNGEQMTIITGIDGYRLTADRTGKYAGNDDPVFTTDDKDTKATVTVYKIVGGIRCGFTASARWSEYYPGPALGFMWDKMPHTMLGKCAEALALRKAFPAELSGIYIKEEMDQADKPINIDTPEKARAAIAKEQKTPIYSGSEPQQTSIKAYLKKQNIPEDKWEDIHRALLGRPFAYSTTDTLLKELGLKND